MRKGKNRIRLKGDSMTIFKRYHLTATDKKIGSSGFSVGS